MEKWVIFTRTFIAYSNINEDDEGCFILIINYSEIPHSFTAFEHQREINMHMAGIFLN